MAETEAKTAEMGLGKAFIVAIVVTAILVGINYLLELIAGG